MFFVGVGLFDWSGVGFDQQALTIVENNRTLISRLLPVFKTLATQQVATTQQGKTGQGRVREDLSYIQMPNAVNCVCR